MVFANRRSVQYLSRLDPSPLRTLDVQADSSQGREENDSLQSNLFALIMLWFSSPMEESDDILGHLRGRCRSTVLVLDQSVKKDTCHGYSATGEEWIIVHSVADFNAGRGVDVASEKREDVITTAMAGLDDQAQIRW